ncbi:MAG: mercury methylation corrinoid protein HgcA [Peptococcaceae bacterium]|nr:mercury methylation corrinoid protein HgcA [Peptococcaceae bacterium]
MTASATLSYKDYFGAWKVRWGIGRMSYSVVPGLYALGTPNFTSPVLVSANYKLTFDTLRKNLTGLDCWILILDTKGVNVWCAAGKGTFGTEELINRIKQTKLTEIVAHRRLILPQLGASGVNSNEVSRRSGFTVVFGPVRASDIKEFLSSGNKATRDMRTVKFTLWDRLVLTPMELVASIKVSMIIFGVLFLLNLFANRPFGALDLLLYITALLIGTVLTPALLPLIPGKAFAFKGWLLGAISTGYILWTNGWLTSPFLLLGIGYMLAMPAYSAFLAMNFTGASTYTSPSGVLKEMKIALPFIAVSLVVGIVLILIKTIMG